MNEAEIVALKREMNFIYSADFHYNREARAGYQQRQDRLQEIMKELANLISRRQWAS